MDQQRIPDLDSREEAFLYDLYVAPQWRDVLNELIDTEVEVPKMGSVLEVGCGTGGFAVELAARLGPLVSVVGVDQSEERLTIAQAKAAIRKLETVTFQKGRPSSLDFLSEAFDLAIADASMLPASELSTLLSELRRVTKIGGTVAMVLVTQGSFGEFFSIYWECLYNLDLLNHAAALEDLIAAHPSVSEIERMGQVAGLNRVRSVTRKHRFDYADATAFLSAPLFDRYFLPEWFALLGDESEVGRVRQEATVIINQLSSGIDFDISIKATIIVGKR